MSPKQSRGIGESTTRWQPLDTDTAECLVEALRHALAGHHGRRVSKLLTEPGFALIVLHHQSRPYRKLPVEQVSEKAAKCDSTSTSSRSDSRRRARGGDEQTQQAFNRDHQTDARPDAGDRERLSSTSCSNASRLATLIVRMCQSLTDLRTLAQWSLFVGVSYSSLCEYSRLAEVQPQNARDFGRVLRAIVRSRGTSLRLSELLDVSDRRTLRSISERAGISSSDSLHRISLDQFIHCQQFLPQRSQTLRGVEQALTGWTEDKVTFPGELHGA